MYIMYGDSSNTVKPMYKRNHRSEPSLRTVHPDEVNDRCSKDQIASGWVGLKGAHDVVGLSLRFALC